MSIFAVAYLVMVLCGFSSFIVVLFGGWLVSCLPDRELLGVESVPAGEAKPLQRAA
jgi:hypothetical protein